MAATIDRTRWLAVAGCLAAAGLAVGCSDADGPEAGATAEALDGRQAYLTLGCAACHGEDLAGKRSGPPLTGLEEHWTETTLVAYLKDPLAMVKATPRLAYKAEQYPIAMPGFADKADEDTLQALAAYLLSQ